MIFSLICTLCIGLAYSTDSSPALMWSPESSMVDLPDVSSSDTFTSSDFHDQYLTPLMQNGKDNAVVFLQDQLSVDDFTNYADVYSMDSNGGAFQNVKRLMEDHYSLEVPQVTSPHEAVEMLKKSFEGDIHMLDSLSKLESLKLGEGRRFLLIVDLEPIAGSGDVEEVITRNDAQVGKVTKYLLERGIKYSALFTGKSASTPEESSDPSADTSLHSNRHLLATDNEAINEKCHFANVSDTVYVFMCGFRVCIKDKKDPSKCMVEVKTNATKSFADSSVRRNKTGEVVVSFTDLEGSDKNKYSVAVVFEVALRQDRWVMERTYLNLTQTSNGAKNSTSIENATLINYNLDTVIPRLYSFHCSRLRLFLETVRDKTHEEFAGSSITLEGFQFQVFDISHNRFFHAQDCVGFFTRGIWMGIFPGLLLLGILLYGTMMVLNLSVMDKFDDPKGKTITVNVAET